MRAGAAISAGQSLTDVSAGAGFCGRSHLADRLTSTFGLTATQLLGAGVVLHLPDDQGPGPGSHRNNTGPRH